MNILFGGVLGKRKAKARQLAMIEKLGLGLDSSNMPRHTAFGDITIFCPFTREVRSTLPFIHLYQNFHLDVLGFATVSSSLGRLAECQRLKGHVPGAVAEGVEMHERAFEREQPLMEGEKDQPSRDCLPMRRRCASPLINSNHLPIRVCTTTNRGGIHLPTPQPFRVMRAKYRIRRARAGVTQPWKMVGPTSSA